MKSSVQWSILLLIKFTLLLASCHYSNSSVYTVVCTSMKVKVTQKCPAVFDPIDYTVHGFLQARILEWVAFPFSGGSFLPRDRTQVSCIAGGFFTSWATGEAQVGSLSLLQQIFLTQESNQGLLHCRRILYQLSYERSLFGGLRTFKNKETMVGDGQNGWRGSKGTIFQL